MELILGGARSGKSRWAEQRARCWRERQTGAELWYVATARAEDDEMRRRISEHRNRRSELWQTCEQPLQLAALLDEFNDRHACVLIDCLTLWISNCLHAGTWPEERAALLASLAKLNNQPRLQVILVSNEVGSGIVPLGALSREFVDAAG
ncbi:MAG TPA: bifunctional adenosylcobinamide kinase/adenosylcobinamide-phosphate guanylyltransferase, partial [Marinobacter sp.]|nr:bifunctional adenosylcobinamide kinase/adenosylcobinamide-phosphate guanylyltransferase [Marinobacter sp.]